MTAGRARIALQILGCAVAVAIVGRLVSQADAASTWRAVSSAGPLVAVALVPFAIGMTLDAWGMVVLLRGLGHRTSLAQMLPVRFASEALHATLPAGFVASDTATAILLEKRAGVPVRDGVVASIARKWLVMRAHAAYIAVGAVAGFATLTALARALHDDLGGSLTAAMMDVAWLTRHPTGGGEGAVRLHRIEGSLTKAIESMRYLVDELQPALLESIGLFVALSAHFGRECRRYGVEYSDTLVGASPPVEAPLAMAIFRIAQGFLQWILEDAAANELRVTTGCGARHSDRGDAEPGQRRAPSRIHRFAAAQAQRHADERSQQ